MLTSKTTVEQAMKNIIKYVCESLQCDQAVIYSMDESGENLRLNASLNDIFPSRLNFNEGIVGKVAASNALLNIR